MDVLKSCERREKRNRKTQIRDIFLYAEVQTRYLFRSDGGEPPHPWEYYPGLFCDDRDAFEAEKAEDMTEACRISRKQYAQEFNRRRQG